MNENDNVRFQKKPISNRTLIMNIDESDIQNHGERSFIQKYKQIYKQLEATDAPWYEQQLLNLEETEIFKSLVDRERQKLQIQREMEGRLALEAWRENDRKKVQENINSIQKQREKNMQKQEQLSQTEKPTPEKTTDNETGTLGKRDSFKERLTASLGFLGVILYFLTRTIVYVLPFVMIGGNFFVTLVLIGINSLLPLSTVIFWIWGLVCAITGVQDIWAIMYYIVFVVVWLPFYIDLIISLIRRIIE